MDNESMFTDITKSVPMQFQSNSFEGPDQYETETVASPYACRLPPKKHSYKRRIESENTTLLLSFLFRPFSCKQGLSVCIAYINSDTAQSVCLSVSWWDVYIGSHLSCQWQRWGRVETQSSWWSREELRSGHRSPHPDAVHPHGCASTVATCGLLSSLSYVCVLKTLVWIYSSSVSSEVNSRAVSPMVGF